MLSYESLKIIKIGNNFHKEKPNYLNFQVDKKILKMIGQTPFMHYAGSNVNMTITTDAINLMIMESGEVSHCLYIQGR